MTPHYYVLHYSVIKSTGGRAMGGWETQVRKGLVELSVMAALQGGEAYGYEILRRLAEAEPLAITESTVYPVLARLAKDGLLAVRVAPSPAGPPRRYYHLTAQGRRHFAQMQSYWKELDASVNCLVFGDRP
ncbi:MAG: PadR family transcriptional regulator [Planctomycetota bacterium]|nr:PadR family transcriptional regulator [Planctomycetota bacterium]